jgi:hypothetical protein
LSRSSSDHRFEALALPELQAALKDSELAYGEI